MLRLIFIILIFALVLYLLFWVKEKFKTLQPETKKKIFTFGLTYLISLIKTKWQIIIQILWHILKRFIRKS